jgi:hypothetical protein
MNLRTIPSRALAPIVLGALAPVLFTLPGCIFVVDSDGHMRHALHVGHQNQNTIRGSGVSKTESRTVPDFRKIVVEGSAGLTVKVGEATTLTVTSDDNLVEFVKTEVKDGSLVIGMKPGSYSTNSQMRIAITTPALDALAIRGSSDADLSGLSGESFTAEIFGSGDVRAKGKVDRLEAAIAGSGDLELGALEAREVKVGISGSGDVDVWATETLVASISGSGDVRYHGDAKVTKSIAGSGTIAQR